MHKAGFLVNKKTFTCVFLLRRSAQTDFCLLLPSRGPVMTKKRSAFLQPNCELRAAGTGNTASLDAPALHFFVLCRIFALYHSQKSKDATFAASVNLAAADMK